MLIPPATDPAESKERDTGFSDRDPMGQVPPQALWLMPTFYAFAAGLSQGATKTPVLLQL